MYTLFLSEPIAIAVLLILIIGIIIRHGTLIKICATIMIAGILFYRVPEASMLGEKGPALPSLGRSAASERSQQERIGILSDSPDGPGVLSPAYGTVTKITDHQDGMTTIVIYLSPFDVHVQFVPADGILVAQKYVPGEFNLAFDKDSEKNERLISTFETARGQIVVEQVAGFVVRRIVCWKKIGDRVTRGELFGMIKLGSQVKITFPGKTSVRVGQHISGGTQLLRR
jgi:phosphatidylserine decarboxylase